MNEQENINNNVEQEQVASDNQNISNQDNNPTQPIIDSINELIAQLGEQTLKMKSGNIDYKQSNVYAPITQRRTNEEWINYIVANPKRFSQDEVMIQRKNVGNPKQFALELQSSYPTMY